MDEGSERRPLIADTARPASPQPRGRSPHPRRPHPPVGRRAGLPELVVSLLVGPLLAATNSSMRLPPLLGALSATVAIAILLTSFPNGWSGRWLTRSATPAPPASPSPPAVELPAARDGAAAEVRSAPAMPLEALAVLEAQVAAACEREAALEQTVVELRAAVAAQEEHTREALHVYEERLRALEARTPAHAKAVERSACATAPPAQAEGPEPLAQAAPAAVCVPASWPDSQ